MPTLWEQLDKFQAIVGRIQAKAPNPRDRQALGELLKQIDKSQTQAQQDLPVLLDHLRDKAKEIKAQAEASREKLTQAMQKADALHQQGIQREAQARALLLPKLEAVPAPAIDPNLGKQLRAELLDKLDKTKRGTGERAERDAWQDWQGFESRSQGQTSPPPPAQPAAPPPAAKKERAAPLAPKPKPKTASTGSDDDDIWSGLSRAADSTIPTEPPPPRKKDPDDA